MSQYIRKIDENGTYLPFYGYTIIGMWNERETCGKIIYNFIKNSSLAKFYSPLNCNSYHMTIFNIYCLSGKIIPPVLSWLQKYNQSLPKNSWLPETFLSCQNAKAEFILSENNLNNIQADSLEMYSKTSLGVSINIAQKKIKSVRQKLSKVYKHLDEGLTKLHMTFAYKIPESPPLDEQAKKDLIILETIIANIENVKFNQFGIYLFDSMENYIKDDFFYSSVPQF